MYFRRIADEKLDSTPTRLELGTFTQTNGSQFVDAHCKVNVYNLHPMRRDVDNDSVTAAINIGASCINKPVESSSWVVDDIYTTSRFLVCSPMPLLLRHWHLSASVPVTVFPIDIAVTLIFRTADR